MIISLFAALSAFLTVIFPEPGNPAAAVEIYGVLFNLQEICVSSSLLITFLGSFAVLWASFAEPQDKPIFYYFIGIESFKRLLLVIPLFILITSLALWAAIKFPNVFTIILSVVGFCIGVVIFSTLLVYLSRATRIKNIAFTTIVYSLVIFILSLFILISVEFKGLPAYCVPIVFFIYAMGTAAVFYVIVTLIFEVILPLARNE